MKSIKLENPKVGVVVVNYDSFMYLKDCIQSIAEQSIPFSKIIIIDNNSKDKDKFSDLPIYRNCEFIQLAQNCGFAKANNLAAERLTDCKWIALVNPDARLHRNWLKNMLDATYRYPSYSFFASRLMMANAPSLIDGVGDTYHMSGLVWRAGHGQNLTISHNTDVFSPCAAAALYRREAFFQTGGFDPDFFCFVEDVDLGFRLRLLGHRCMLVKDSIAYHVGSTSTGGQHSSFSIYHGHRNMVWTYIKNMPGVLFWIFLPLHLALNVFSIGWFLCKGEGKTIIQAKFDALIGLPTMWQKRKQVQSKRTVSTNNLLSVIDKRLTPNRRRM